MFLSRVLFLARLRVSESVEEDDEELEDDEDEDDDDEDDSDEDDEEDDRSCLLFLGAGRDLDLLRRGELGNSTFSV